MPEKKNSEIMPEEMACFFRDILPNYPSIEGRIGYETVRGFGDGRQEVLRYAGFFDRRLCVDGCVYDNSHELREGWLEDCLGDLREILAETGLCGLDIKVLGSGMDSTRVKVINTGFKGDASEENPQEVLRIYEEQLQAGEK